MRGKTEYIALINPVPGLPEAEQRALLGKYQPAESFTVDKDGTLEQFIGLARPPRVILVAYVALLAEQRGDKSSRSDSMVAAKVAIHRRGTYIQEADGRRSDKHWRTMKPAGCRMCGRLAQGRKSALNAKRGAKPYLPTAEERAIMREEWFSKSNRTVTDAMKRIKKRLGMRAPGRTTVYKIFGSPYASR